MIYLIYSSKGVSSVSAATHEPSAALYDRSPKSRETILIGGEKGELLALVLGNQTDQGHGGNDQPEPYIEDRESAQMLKP